MTYHEREETMVENTKRWNWKPKKIFEMRLKMGQAMEGGVEEAGGEI